jgi:hypothetical protein
MTYANVGVQSPHNASKKAMKEAIKADPSKVYFYTTSMFPPQWNGSAAELPDDLVLSVVGPDPERKRSWYASVEKRKDGTVIVK